jgi:hypothetical protein
VKIDNLSFNNNDILVIAVGNPLIESDKKNIITGTGDIYYILPEKYRQYVR